MSSDVGPEAGGGGREEGRPTPDARPPTPGAAPPKEGAEDDPALGAWAARLARNFRWQAFFQRCRDPLFVLGRHRRPVFVNQAWEALTGLPAAEAHLLVCRRPPGAHAPGSPRARAGAGDDLEGHHPLHQDVLGLVHPPHAAGPERLEDAVGPEA